MQESWRTRIVRWVLNFWPCIRGTGVRVRFVSSDYKCVRVELPLTWRTRNVVGTIFGGSLYGAVDPFLMLMLLKTLGDSYVVWDKAAHIRFRRPGTSKLRTEFLLTDTKLAEVRSLVESEGEAEFTWNVELRDSTGTVCASVDKVIYVATKAHFREKAERRKARAA